MKAIVIYYSFEGNTKLVAENIANEIGADIEALIPVKEISSKGFMKYVWGGGQVMMKKRPELKPLVNNLEEYDMIFLGTPIWAYTYAPPLRSFLESNNITNKKIALFSTHEGQNGKTFSHFKENLPNNLFLGEIDFFAPLKREKDKAIARAREWAKEIITKAKSEVKQ